MTVPLPALTTVALFALVTLIQTATPGPGVLYVSARSLAQGRRAGFASMFGIESGEVVWLAAAATGVAALLSASQAALTGLRFAGAAYLIYLGIQRWRSAAETITAPRAGLVRTYMQGLVTQLLNPKVAVFFVAFLPQFLDPAKAIALQVAVLGVVYIAIAISVDVTYVVAASSLSARFARSKKNQVRAGRVAAASYMAIGVAAAATGVREL